MPRMRLGQQRWKLSSVFSCLAYMQFTSHCCTAKCSRCRLVRHRVECFLRALLLSPDRTAAAFALLLLILALSDKFLVIVGAYYTSAGIQSPVLRVHLIIVSNGTSNILLPLRSWVMPKLSIQLSSSLLLLVPTAFPGAQFPLARF